MTKVKGKGIITTKNRGDSRWQRALGAYVMNDSHPACLNHLLEGAVVANFRWLAREVFRAEGLYFVKLHDVGVSNKRYSQELP